MNAQVFPTPAVKPAEDKSAMKVGSKTNPKSVHGWAKLLTALTFPLIWVGGLVTTYDAGMAVPDWPGTYGYNLFAYPWQTWLFGPFDLLIEHGHRLLASLVGLVAIVLVVVAYRSNQGRLVKSLSIACLAAVLFQGLLGGARVLLDARTLAMVHGCFGPAFFALCTLTAVCCSPLGERGGKGVFSPWFVRIAVAMAVASYLQLTIGAQLRHILPWASPKFFQTMVHLHLTLAGTVFLIAAVLAGLGMREPDQRIRRPAMALVGVVLLQILLGLGTWIANYALPWEDLFPWLSEYIIRAKGYWESLVITMHMATGSLIIAISVMLATRGWLLSSRSETASDGELALARQF